MRRPTPSAHRHGAHRLRPFDATCGFPGEGPSSSSSSSSSVAPSASSSAASASSSAPARSPWGLKVRFSLDGEDQLTAVADVRALQATREQLDSGPEPAAPRPSTSAPRPRCPSCTEEITLEQKVTLCALCSEPMHRASSCRLTLHCMPHCRPCAATLRLGGPPTGALGGVSSSAEHQDDPGAGLPEHYPCPLRTCHSAFANLPDLCEHMNRSHLAFLRDAAPADSLHALRTAGLTQCPDCLASLCSDPHDCPHGWPLAMSCATLHGVGGEARHHLDTPAQ